MTPLLPPKHPGPFTGGCPQAPTSGLVGAEAPRLAESSPIQVFKTEVRRGPRRLLAQSWGSHYAPTSQRHGHSPTR